MAAGKIKAPTIIPLRLPVAGKNQLQITTKTRIEIATDTSGMDIIFTINGNKPSSFEIGKGSFKYQDSFCLPPGKRTVKAIAMSKDASRESSVMSKTFDVDFEADDDAVGSDAVQDDRYGFLDDLKIKKKREAAATEKVLKSQTLFSKESNQNGKHEEEKTDATTMNSVQAFRIQRTNDFLKCIYCLTPRPSDPFAMHCPTCGQVLAPLPTTRLPPPEPTQLVLCPLCNSHVPLNSEKCIVCEHSMKDNSLNRVQFSKASRLCPVCGTGNQPDLSFCVVCESKLQNSMSTQLTGESSKCFKCAGFNSKDASFCGSCGNNLKSNYLDIVTCKKCYAANKFSAKYCCQCGCNLLDEIPLFSGNSQSQNVNNHAIPMNGASTRNFNENIMHPEMKMKNYKSFKSMSDISTQTVGLAYPNLTGPNKPLDQIRNGNTQEKTLIQTVTSPGRGFWKKQLDHVITHLKGYANNDPEFQAIIGEPRMGKLISADINEDEVSLDLTLTFALRNFRDPFKSGIGNNENRRPLSSVLRDRADSIDSFETIDSDKLASGKTYSKDSGRPKARVKSASKANQKAKAYRTPQKAKAESKLTELDRLLLKEVGSRIKKTQPLEVQRLIDEGANPKCINGDGIPILILAVRHRHADLIPVLIQMGSDPQAKEPIKGNTALHEAVLLGLDGEPILASLLKCKLSMKMKNHAGETALEMANRIKSPPEIIKKFMEQMGQSQLNKLTMSSDLADDKKLVSI